MMAGFAFMVLAASFSVQPLPQADGPLEPSVQNEVDHAIVMGERWLATAAPTNGPHAVAGDIFGTNGQTRVQIALSLVSSQHGGGWWLTSTNAAPTRCAVEILKGL